jgi:hypothetical protein
MADTPRPPVRPVADTAEVNLVYREGFARPKLHQAERRDTALNYALPSAAWPPSAWPLETEAPAPPPSEETLRDLLADALHLQQLADEALRRAERAHERAEEHKQVCQRRVAESATLERELSEATTTALRDGTDADAAREPFAPRLAARADAQADAVSAESAVATLRAERSTAASAAGAAAKEVNVLATRVLTFAAERIAGEIRELRAEIGRRRRSLLGFDRLITPTGLPFPGLVKSALGEVTGQDVASADAVPWRAAMTVLKADALATVTIELPALILPPVPVMQGPPSFTRAVPIKLPEPPPVPPDDGDPGFIPPEDVA